MTVFRQICILILLADISFTDKGTESRTGRKNQPDYFAVSERNSAAGIQKGSVSFSLKKFRLRRVRGRGNRRGRRKEGRLERRHRQN